MRKADEQRTSRCRKRIRAMLALWLETEVAWHVARRFEGEEPVAVLTPDEFLNWRDCEGSYRDAVVTVHSDVAYTIVADVWEIPRQGLAAPDIRGVRICGLPVREYVSQYLPPRECFPEVEFVAMYRKCMESHQRDQGTDSSLKPPSTG